MGDIRSHKSHPQVTPGDSQPLGGQVGGSVLTSTCMDGGCSGSSCDPEMSAQVLASTPWEYDLIWKRRQL